MLMRSEMMKIQRPKDMLASLLTTPIVQVERQETVVAAAARMVDNIVAELGGSVSAKNRDSCGRGGEDGDARPRGQLGFMKKRGPSGDLWIADGFCTLSKLEARQPGRPVGAVKKTIVTETVLSTSSTLCNFNRFGVKVS